VIPVTPTDLVARLARALDDEEPCRLLDRAGLGCGFGDGGCRILAEALRRVLGGDLFAVYRDDGVMDHVTLGLGGRYLDVDGLHTEGELLDNNGRASGRPFILSVGPFKGDLADESAIPFDELTTAALAEYLRGRLTEGSK
jgi:hypothetical protein